MIKYEKLSEWANELREYKLPRWENLPDFDLYMDQVLSLTENYLYVFNTDDEKKIITSSMINNYVKLGMLPKPNKKRYTKMHLVYLIAFTVLKQVLTIPEIKQGILYQASISGIEGAYDLFCAEQEHALKSIAAQICDAGTVPLMKEDTDEKNMLIRSASLAVAAKMLTEKIIVSIAKEDKADEIKQM